jgi:O-antigen/teichoic acid export membrane protein
MYKVTITELIGKIIQLSIIFIGVHFNLGFTFIILGITIGMFSNFIIIYFLSRKFITFKLDFDIHKWKIFLQESWPIGLSVIVTFIYFKADIFLLKWLSTNEAVGIYGAGYKVLENITFFPGMIMGLIMPMLSYYILKDKKKFFSLINENFKLFTILIIPLLIITLFFAENIIVLITSPEYLAAATVLRIVVFSLAFIFFGMLFGSIMIAAKLQKQQLIALSVCAIFNVSANLIFIPKYSYLATSYVSVATELLVVILSVLIVYKNLHFLPKLKNFNFIILAGLIMATYIFILQSLPFLVLLITSPLVYFTILILSKVITKKELSLLFKK